MSLERLKKAKTQMSHFECVGSNYCFSWYWVDLLKISRSIIFILEDNSREFFFPSNYLKCVLYTLCITNCKNNVYNNINGNNHFTYVNAEEKNTWKETFYYFGLGIDVSINTRGLCFYCWRHDIPQSTYFKMCKIREAKVRPRGFKIHFNTEILMRFFFTIVVFPSSMPDQIKSIFRLWDFDSYNNILVFSKIQKKYLPWFVLISI